MAVRDHTHKLKKHKYKTGVSVFFCTLDCNYKIEAPFALGKLVLCNICGNPFTMNEYSIRLNTPHCNNCGRREVKTPDGKKHYVRKVNAEVLAGMADEEVSDLKARLEKATTSNSSTEDDIL